MQEEGTQKLSFLSFSFGVGGGNLESQAANIDACTDGYTSILCEAQVARGGGV